MLKKSLFLSLAALIAWGCQSAGKATNLSPRLETRFNQNWEFILGISNQNQIPEKFLVPKKGWKVVHVSSEETSGETAPARNVFDGNPVTFWHTQWQNAQPDYPHELIIDLGREYLLEGFAYVPRQDSRNGMIKDFEIYIGTDSSHWDKPVLKSRFKDSVKMQLQNFPSAKKGRFVRFRALTPMDDAKPFAAIAELDFIKRSDTGSAWEDQFMIMHVQNSQKGDTQKLTLDQELKPYKGKIWEKVTLPHSVIEPRVVKAQWQGICFYRKNFTIDVTHQGKKIFLEFEGAMHLADVWINDRHQLQHAGGYTPFTIDITDDIRYGEKNIVTVKLDNRDNPEIPPGKPVSTLDFNYFSGLYRDVNLIIKDKLHITNPVYADVPAGGGIFVTYSDVSETSATVNIKTHVRNEYNQDKKCTILQKLFDNTGSLVAENSSNLLTVASGGNHTATQQLRLKSPRLWCPETPNLYSLVTEVVSHGKTVDRQTTRIGIRRLEFSRTEGFKINGQPLKLRGTNRHQDYPWIGNAASNNLSHRDMWKIKNAGFNTVRLGHYPQDPSVYEACDELGLLAIDPIPGWQFFNRSETFIKRTYQNIRDMIRRDRNHPCVIMWEVILNESWPPNDWKDKAHQIAHEEYPGPQCFTAGDMYGYFGWDILYNDWNENHTRPNDSKKPGFIREYGDYEFGGGNSTTRKVRGDGEAALLGAAWNVQWSHNKHLSQYPWTFGDANWAMFDHNRGCATTLSACGNADICRLPKFSYYFFQSQRDPEYYHPAIENGPMVYLANYWTERTSPCKVVVFSNCDEVVLFINGKSVAKQKPDHGPDTLYHPQNIRHTGGSPFDGGNCRNLAHAPFTFTDIKWAPGELKAVGYLGGNKVAENIRRTPQEPVGVEIKFDLSDKSLQADGADAIFVHAYLVDKNGTTCWDSSGSVEFTVQGPARIVSPAQVYAEAGIATVLLQARTTPGKITIQTQSKNLKTATAEIVSVD